VARPSAFRMAPVGRRDLAQHGCRGGVHKKMRLEQPIATFILGIGGIALAIAGILSHVSTLLNDAGDVIIPFTFVMLVDWLYVQRRRTAAAAFFEHPHDFTGRIVPSSIASVIVGFVSGYWGNHFLPGLFYNTLPLPVVGGIVAAALYALAATARPRPSTAAATAPPTVTPTA